MNQEFFAVSIGGISNRVKILASCMRFSDKYDGKTFVYWPETMTCHAKFSELFDTDIKEVSRDSVRDILKGNQFKYLDDETKIYPKSSKRFNVFSGGRWILNPTDIDFNKTPEGIEFDYENIPKKLQQEFIDNLKKLKPAKDIQGKIDKFMSKHDLRNFVGVHIRRGDFVNSSANCFGNVSSDKAFVEKMEREIKLNPKLKFFLCTDSEELEKSLGEKFNGKIVSFKKSSFDKIDREFVKEGLIDLLLLSKTKLIIGTYRSTFTELAWWFGGCKARVEVPVDQEELKKYINRKTDKSLLQKIKEFIFIKLTPLHKRVLG